MEVLSRDRIVATAYHLYLVGYITLEQYDQIKDRYGQDYAAITRELAEDKIRVILLLINIVMLVLWSFRDNSWLMALNAAVVGGLFVMLTQDGR